MKFKEQFSKLHENAIDYIYNSLFDEIDLEHLDLYHTYNNGENNLIQTIVKDHNVYSVTFEDGWSISLDNLDTYNICCIADEFNNLNL